MYNNPALCTVLFISAQDHITLLLSCYAKIRDDAQIDTLLENIALNPGTKTGEFSSFLLLLWYGTGHSVHNCRELRYFQHIAVHCWCSEEIRVSSSPPISPLTTCITLYFALYTHCRHDGPQRDLERRQGAPGRYDLVGSFQRRAGHQHPAHRGIHR